jgi:exodeoxyribonuclease-3
LEFFSYGDYKLELLDDHNPEIKIISPISVIGEHINFTLFAIWAHNPNDPDGQYIEQVWKAIHQYDNLLTSERTILTGDFNSNTIWDRKNRMANHSAVVDKLALKNIYSVYHRYLNQVQGKEDHPTFFLQRNKNKPYHLDYCFASIDLYDKVTNIQIGSFENWIPHSDHTPIIISFDL